MYSKVICFPRRHLPKPHESFPRSNIITRYWGINFTAETVSEKFSQKWIFNFFKYIYFIGTNS